MKKVVLYSFFLLLLINCSSKYNSKKENSVNIHIDSLRVKDSLLIVNQIEQTLKKVQRKFSKKYKYKIDQSLNNDCNDTPCVNRYYARQEILTCLRKAKKFYLCYPYIYVSNVLVYPYPQSKENRFYILEAVYYDDKHKLDSVYNFVDSVVTNANKKPYKRECMVYSESPIIGYYRFGNILLSVLDFHVYEKPLENGIVNEYFKTFEKEWIKLENKKKK